MQLHSALLAIGALFLVGLVADMLGRRTHVPRVTLLMLVGLLIGPVGFDIVPVELELWYEFLAAAALTMVAFLLGGSLSPATMRRHGRQIVIVSVTVAAAGAAVMAGGLVLAGVPFAMALLLAGISTATDPAATLDVVRQSRKRGRFSQLLLGVVAIDDAWGLIIFSVMLLTAKALAGDGGMHILLDGMWEIGGALTIGVGLGLPAAALTGRLRRGEPLQIEMLAVVFLCAGLAIWMQVSFLLAGMICGVMVANFARHHERPFHEVENIEWPFMVLFFVLAGASLRTDAFGALWIPLILYVALRVAARLACGWLGGFLAGLEPAERRWIGAAIMPQAGVAVGMALVAGDHFPELRQEILSITIATTILFELTGPLITHLALARVAPSPSRRQA